MRNKPKISIIGVGRWGKNLLKEFNNIATVVSCANGGSPVNNRWVKKNYPHIKIASSYKEILNDEGIDAVIIATPIETHYKITKEALAAGKHVFVEKPLTKKVSEAKKLLSLAKRKNVILFVGYIFLYSDVFVKLKSILKQEHIKHIEFNLNKFGTFEEELRWNLLSHDLSIAISLLGAPKSISRTNSTGFITKLDILNIVANFSGKRTCTFNINRLSDIKEKTIEVIATKNTFIWRGTTLYKLDRKTGKFRKIFSQSKTPLALECSAFIKSIKTEKTPLSDGKFGLKVTETIESLKT